MPKESNLELKVGAFVLVAFVCLIVFVFSVGDFNFFEKGKNFKVVFNFANGVRKSAPVRVAGVDQGMVRDISVFFDEVDRKTKVAVAVRVKEDTKIPIDSEIIINQLGLLGEKYIEVIPGVDTVNFFGEGDVVVGRDPVAQETISKKVVEVATKVEASIDSLNKIIGDADNQQSVKETLARLSSMLGKLSELAETTAEGKGTLGHLFYDDGLYNNLEELTADLKMNPWKLLYVPKSDSSSRKK